MMSPISARRFLAVGAIGALAALTLAACGSSGGSSSASTQPPMTSTGAPATVGVTSTSLGNTLVDAQGRTLYLFQKDTGTTSTCTGACATAWPPLIAPGAPTTGSGANASLIGNTMRQDGKTQVTYNGHPLYLFEADQKPGDATGQNVDAFGAKWYVLSATGDKVTSKGSGGGYAY
jgi:predicted lipoprotein with Yx(FWY)xxD motif